MGMIDKAKGMVQAVKSGAPGDESSSTADAGNTVEVKASEATASGLAA